MRLLSEWMFIKRNVPVAETAFGTIEDVCWFKYALEEDTLTHTRCIKHVGDFCAFDLGDCIHEYSDCKVEHKGVFTSFGKVMDDWTSLGARFVITTSVRDHKSQCIDRVYTKDSFVTILVCPLLLPLIRSGHWSTIAAKDRKKLFYQGKAKGKGIWKFIGCPSPTTNSLIKEEGLAANANLVSFEPKMFEAAAARLRGQVIEFPGEGDVLTHISTNDVLGWCDAMAHHCANGLDHAAQLSRHGILRATRYATEHLITLVRICNLLRNDRRLTEAVELVGRLLQFPDGWLEEKVILPSNATVSRHRFTLDTAYTWLVRRRLRDWINAGVKFVVCMLWDSSPRKGREWLLGEAYIIREDHLEQFESAMMDLAEHRHNVRLGRCDFDSSQAMDWATCINDCIWHYIFAPVCLGSKNQTLAPQFAAVLHAIRLLCDCWKMAKLFCASTLNFTTDLGVESGLVTIPDYNANSLCKHWNEMKVVDDHLEFSFGGTPMAQLSDAVMSFQSSLGVPGTEHLCHGMEEQVTKKLNFFKLWFGGASNLGRFLNGTFYTDRLSATCFAGRDAQAINAAVASFGCVPYEKRFGSICTFIDELRPLKDGLQMFYQESVFQAKAKDETGETEEWCDISKVNWAIKSNFWWAYGSCLGALQVGIEEVRNFTRSCHCHRIRSEEEVSISTYRRRSLYEKETGLKKPCAGKGLVAAEMADGKAMKTLRRAWETARSMLLAECVGL